MTDQSVTLHHGDCLEVLRGMADASIDAIVTDPPYGLTTEKAGGSGVASVNLDSPYGRARIGTGNGAGGFMGMKWDSDVPPVEMWAECLRVLKPGGYLLAFFGTRTYHRGVTRIEDAGFEVRDQIGWAFGSGFPKSHNGPWGGTALKPAWEPIVIARKPLIGTVEANWREFGTGALNIDGCRIPHANEADKAAAFPAGRVTSHGAGSLAGPGAAQEVARSEFTAERSNAGRWPANLIHDGSDEVLAAFPYASGAVAPVKGTEPTGHGFSGNVFGAPGTQGRQPIDRRDGGGSAARFFYCAKASKSDRDEGLDDMPDRVLAMSNQAKAELACGNMHEGESGMNTDKVRKNNHPTVKPTDLMRYLCRLVTPAGGVVLDPFMGSGSTGKAAVLEGFRFVGIEREADYMTIARARIAHAQAEVAEAAAAADAASRQADLFGEVVHA